MRSKRDIQVREALGHNILVRQMRRGACNSLRDHLRHERCGSVFRAECNMIIALQAFSVLGLRLLEELIQTLANELESSSEG